MPCTSLPESRNFAGLLPRWVCAVWCLTAAGWSVASACPFCTVESQTLSEELRSVDAAVLAKLVREATEMRMGVQRADGAAEADSESDDAMFEIVDVLRGQDRVAAGQQIEVVYFGPAETDQLYLITGIGSEPVGWTTPLPLSAAAVDYIQRLASVPAAGADRLAYFQDYLEHGDPLLAQDAYDEFARAPYPELQEFGDRMNHDQLVAWIKDLDVSPSGRRLYLTMLGVCGTADDLPLLEEMIVSDFAAKKPVMEQVVSCGLSMGGPLGLPMCLELAQLEERRKKLALDALVAAYLTLRGPQGLDLIDERFLKDPNVEYTYVYSTIMALRFHGDQTEVMPRGRLLQSMRLLLDNQDFADQVIIDLSRWEDWSVLERLAEMFKTADEKNQYVRQPVVTYLTVASEQEGDVGRRASAALEELEQLDPEAVEQARRLAAFGLLARARSTNSNANASRPTTVAAASTTAVEPVDTNVEPVDTNAVEAAVEDTDEIPDPADFAAQSPLPPGDSSATSTEFAAAPAVEMEAEVEQSSPSEEPTPTVDANSAANQNGLDFAAEPAEEAESVAASAPIAETDPSASGGPVPPGRWWIVGLPLAAAVMLMGLYWLILRSGAV